MSDPPSLLSLPPRLVDRILAAAILVDPPTASRLALVSKDLARAARRTLAHDLTLPDDDTLLLDAQATPALESSDSSRGPGAVPPPRPASGTAPPAAVAASNLLDKVARSTDWALDVRHCKVVAPLVPGDYSPLVASTRTGDRRNGDDGHGGDEGNVDEHQDDNDDDEVPIPPLDDTAFFLLVSRLSNLTSFTWSSYRLPPDALCLALGQACKSLTAFKLDLVASPFAHALADSHGVSAAAAPGSPQQLAATSPSSPPSLMSLGLGGNGHAHGYAHSGGAPQRWDAPHLSALPHTLVRLAVSHLSAAGARSLGSALPSFPALETLELARTLFVDDALLAEVGAGARGLKRLVVRDMGGTKLSEQGLQALFDGCEALEVLELDCVEGASRSLRLGRVARAKPLGRALPAYVARSALTLL